MKKLLITLEYPPQFGGVAAYLEGLVSELNRDSIVILSPKHPASLVYDNESHVKIIRKDLLYKIGWPKWARAFFEAHKIVFSEKIDQVIISHLLPMGYVALLLQKPYTVIIHGMDVLCANKNSWKRYWAKKILLKAINIIANSEFTKQETIKLGVYGEKIKVVYPCPSVELSKIIIDDKKAQEFVDKYNLKDKKILLSVCRLVERKGCDKGIEALAKLKVYRPNFKYLIVGNGPDQVRLEKLISRLNVRDEVIILNQINFQDLAYFYHLSDIFIMNSRQIKCDVEGYGLTALEAALFGKPAIGGSSGGVAEAIINGKTGIIVDPNNVQELTGKISELLNDPYLRLSLGMAAKNRVISEFTWKKQMKKVKSILA